MVTVQGFKRILAGLFISAAFLKLLTALFSSNSVFSWSYFLIAILPAVVIYVIFGLFAINQWDHFSSCWKGFFVGVGIQYILLLFFEITNYFIFVGRSLFPMEMWISYYPWIILSPLEAIYGKYIISQRVIYNSGSAIFMVYRWETGLVMPLIRILYAGSIGYFFGKLTDSYTIRSITGFHRNITHYSYSQFLSFLASAIGYLLVFLSEEYFLIFLALSFLSIIFGHMSFKRMVHPAETRGRLISIMGLFFGYTLLLLTIIIFLRINGYL